MKKQHFIAVVVIVLAIGSALLLFKGFCKKPPNSSNVTAILPLSGPTAFIGEYCRNGIELATEDLKRKGCDIRLTVYDSKNDPKEGVAVFAKSLSEHPSAVIVAMSSVALAISPQAEREKIPLVATTVSADGVAKGKDWTFRLFINADIDARLMAEFACKNMTYRRLGIIRVNDEMGVSFANVFKKVSEANGATIIYEESFRKSQTDFKSLVAKIKASKVDAIYLVGYDMNLGILAREIRIVGIHTQFLATATISQQPVVKAAGNAIEGTFFTSVLFDPKKPRSNKTKSFIDAYRDKYNSMPTYFSAFAYDSAILVGEAIQKEGASPEDVRRGLLNIRHYEGVTGKISIESNGEAVFPMIIKRMTKGKSIKVNDND